MKHSLTERLDERKRRWKKFLSPEATPGFMFLVRLNDPVDPPPIAVPLRRDLQRERIEYLWKLYQYQIAQAGSLDDDALPCLNMLTGRK